MIRQRAAMGAPPRLALLALALAAGLLVVPSPAQAQVTRFNQEVYDSIQRGLEYLRRVGVRTGGRYVHRNGRGMDGIAAVVFLDQPRSPDPRDGFSGFRGMPPLDRVAVVRMLRACIDEENTLRASGNSVFLST